MAEKLLCAIAAPCTLSLAIAHLGASIGVAFPASQEETMPELLKRADQAMYRAKAAGRNSVVIDPVTCWRRLDCASAD